ncbi:type IV toxin-antitoxin system AbiEi family antitoxin domain-containing protein [Paenibacillus sp. FSL R7-0210]|uniref:type IV toxin-antitoxin system AbiEi family antitoxin domain-containing protein n=1 Tax=Paenibacillus sp. FSL R7-0210 TaxID=2921676 RepID=UPI0030F65980
MSEAGDIDYIHIKKGFSEILEHLNMQQEDFFELIYRYPNIKNLDGLIEAIKSATGSEAEAELYPEVIDLFKTYNGIANGTILKENQVSYYKLRKLEERGEIIRLKRGLYALRDINYVVDEIVEASLLVPNGVLCLYSALAHHELTTYTPGEYNFAVSRKSRKPLLPEYPPIRLFSYDDVSFTMGVEQIDKEGHIINVYNLERTICDIVKYRNKLDANVVKESLNNYSSSKRKNYTRLLRYADKLRVRSILDSYLEVL